MGDVKQFHTLIVEGFKWNWVADPAMVLSAVTEVNRKMDKTSRWQKWVQVLQV